MSEQDEQILPQHQRLIDDSAISPEVTEARRYRSVSTKAELGRLGFGEKQCRVPALLIPIWNVRGEIANYQIRPDQPRVNERGKAVKYETPRKSRMVLDVPPLARQWIGDPNKPLFITEGARKADSAVSQGLCCIDVLGVWNWRGSNDFGGKTALADWESIALNDRQVYICFDSDVMLKHEVHAAMARLKEFLENRRASVSLIYLESAADGAKVGLDDYFAAGHSVADLMKLASSELLSPPEGDGDENGLPYIVSPRGIIWNKRSSDGVIEIQLTNFAAKIAAEVLEDDGAENRLLFEIEAELGGKPCRFSVGAGQFGGMGWVTERLGAKAVLYPGFGTRDRARTAIQLLSGDVPRKRVYTHTGWRETDGGWVYLHGGGAIGVNGVVGGVEVRLPPALAAYELPPPPDGQDLIRSVRSSLGMLDVVPETVSFPLFCTIWAAVLGNGDLSVHLTGPTGCGKTQLAALAQQHWGPRMDSNHLPASWSSTGNALEALAFGAKDALLVVDDFAPAGSSIDVSRLHREADRLLRAQGNNSGRQRMRADASLRLPKPPRGIIFGTGEDVPRGGSLRARMVVLELEPDAMDWQRLMECQRHASDGLYAAAMSGFLSWLAPRYGDLKAGLRQRLEELRTEASVGTRHKRTPSNTARLGLGLRLFVDFAMDRGVLSQEEADALWRRGWSVLKRVADSQAQHHAACEPARRFVELIQAAISSGLAHVAGEDGSEPEDADVWGWSTSRNGSGGFHPQGSRIGWVVGDDLFLQPDASLAAAQRLARDSGEGLTIGQRTLNKRLREQGYLASSDAGRGTATVRRTLENARRDVLHLRASLVMCRKTDQTDQTDQGLPDHEGNGQFPGQSDGQFCSDDPPKTDHENCPQPARARSEGTPVVKLVSSCEGGDPEDWGIAL